MSKIEFDAVLVSPFQRTLETAEIISHHLILKKPAEILEMLGERKNPSEIVNKSAEIPEIKQIIDIIDKSFHDDNFRFSDEENFTDLKERAEFVLNYLASRPEQKILVITHSIFLKMIAAVITEGNKLTARKYNLMSFLNDSNNASITICEYEVVPAREGFISWLLSKKKGVWKMLAWDDYSRETK